MNRAIKSSEQNWAPLTREAQNKPRINNEVMLATGAILDFEPTHNNLMLN